MTRAKVGTVLFQLQRLRMSQKHISARLKNLDVELKIKLLGKGS
jgi:hypothetical protein